MTSRETEMVELGVRRRGVEHVTYFQVCDGVDRICLRTKLTNKWGLMTLVAILLSYFIWPVATTKPPPAPTVDDDSSVEDDGRAPDGVAEADDVATFSSFRLVCSIVCGILCVLVTSMGFLLGYFTWSIGTTTPPPLPTVEDGGRAVWGILCVLAVLLFLRVVFV